MLASWLGWLFVAACRWFHRPTQGLLALCHMSCITFSLFLIATCILRFANDGSGASVDGACLPAWHGTVTDPVKISTADGAAL